MRLDGKRVLVTGASKGIGQAIAETFTRAGARVLLTARSSDVIEIADSLAGQGGDAFGHCGDITDEAQLLSIVRLCRERLGGIDVLVNNAGILLPGKLGMVKTKDARQMLETNLIAMINLTQYVIRLVGRDHGGSVINLASIAGCEGLEGMSAYSASKAGVIGFTRAAAKELAPQHIRVNAIAPGFIQTNMTLQLGADQAEQTLKKIRIGRVGIPQDVANCALFLASDLSTYITGQVIGIDGGMQA